MSDEKSLDFQGFGHYTPQPQSTRRRRKRDASAALEIDFACCLCSPEVSGKQRQKGRLTEDLEATKTPPPLRTATVAAENERRQIACFLKLQSLKTAASTDSETTTEGRLGGPMASFLPLASFQKPLENKAKRIG